MAYDPNDAADKKIVKDLIDAALAEQAESHEADISGLRNKNKDLLNKIKQNKDYDPEELSNLQDQLAENKRELTKAQKALEKVTSKSTELETGLASERTFSENLLKENGLTAALTGVKVASAFLPAVKALLAPKVVIKVEGDQRLPFVGDKSLGDFVTEWSQGDEGKHYVSANLNGGGGAGGGGNKVPGAKVISRSDFNQMLPETHASFFKGGGTIQDQEPKLWLTP